MGKGQDDPALTIRPEESASHNVPVKVRYYSSTPMRAVLQ
jgi:hypothetical protein